MTYKDMDGEVERVKSNIEERVCDLHPVDKAKAFREIQSYTADRARDEESYNTEHGVPERRPTPAELDDDGDFI